MVAGRPNCPTGVVADESPRSNTKTPALWEVPCPRRLPPGAGVCPRRVRCRRCDDIVTEQMISNVRYEILDHDVFDTLQRVEILFERWQWGRQPGSATQRSRLPSPDPTDHL